MLKLSRKTALDYIRIAGYHDDQKSFMRLYCENRVSYPAAIKAYRLGAKQKSDGMACSCHSCKTQQEASTC